MRELAQGVRQTGRMMQPVDGHAGHLERDASERDRLPRVNDSNLPMNLWRPSLDCMTPSRRLCISSARRTIVLPCLSSGTLSLPLRSFVSFRTPNSSASSQRSLTSSDRAESITRCTAYVDGSGCIRVSCSAESSQLASSKGSTSCSRDCEVDATFIRFPSRSGGEDDGGVEDDSIGCRCKVATFCVAVRVRSE